MQNNKSIVITRKNVLDVKGEKYVPLDLLFSHQETLFIEDPTALLRRYHWQGNTVSIPASGLYTDSAAGEFDWRHSYVDELADRSRIAIVNNLLNINDSNIFKTYCSYTRSYSWASVGSLMISENRNHSRVKAGVRWMMFIPEEIYLKLRKKIYEDKQTLDRDLDIDPLFKVGYLVFDGSAAPSNYLKDFRTHISDCGGKPRTQVQNVGAEFFDSMHVYPLDSLGLEIVDPKWQVKAFKDFVDDEFSRLGFEEKTEETEEVPTGVSADAGPPDGSRPVPGVGLREQIQSEEAQFISVNSVDWDNFGSIVGSMGRIGPTGSTGSSDNIGVTYTTGIVGPTGIRETGSSSEETQDTVTMSDIDWDGVSEAIRSLQSETTVSNSTESSISDESEGITDEELQEIREMLEEMSNNRTTSNE